MSFSFRKQTRMVISDMAIMLSGGITVPAYTTYTEDDYNI